MFKVLFYTLTILASRDINFFQRVIRYLGYGMNDDEMLREAYRKGEITYREFLVKQNYRLMEFVNSVYSVMMHHKKNLKLKDNLEITKDRVYDDVLNLLVENNGCMKKESIKEEFKDVELSFLEDCCCGGQLRAIEMKLLVLYFDPPEKKDD